MSVEFVRSASEPQQFPRDGMPEIAFIGRSNVGKSSLINSLLLASKSGLGAAPTPRKQLAHISRTPGRTQNLNFYLVDQAFYFVDLPGYGYAKVAKREIDRWKQLIENYLIDREVLRLAVLIVDSRHGAKTSDQQMIEWLESRQQPFVLVASKTDKLRSSERGKTLRILEKNFSAILPFSAKTGEGLTPLWRRIRNALTQ